MIGIGGDYWGAKEKNLIDKTLDYIGEFTIKFQVVCCGIMKAVCEEEPHLISDKSLMKIE
jgi:hypothetical protein